jgi:16S rRNA (cytosine967-C5)-methyltransferase
MDNCGEIVAVDISAKKLELVHEMCQRLGINIVTTKTGNGTVLFGIEGQFDRVIADVPCSGLGVLRRRADIRWKKNQEDLADLPALQLAILSRAADYVKPGGILMYTTCSIEPGENFEVVKAFRAARPEFVPDDISGDISSCLAEAGGTTGERAGAGGKTEERVEAGGKTEERAEAGGTTGERAEVRTYTGSETQWKKGMWQIMPHIHGMDGFFISRMRRVDTTDR